MAGPVIRSTTEDEIVLSKDLAAIRNSSIQATAANQNLRDSAQPARIPENIPPLQRREAERTQNENFVKLATYAQADNFQGFQKTLRTINPEQGLKPAEEQEIFKQWRLGVLERLGVLLQGEIIKGHNEGRPAGQMTPLYSERRINIDQIVKTKHSDEARQRKEIELVQTETLANIIKGIDNPVAKEDATRAALQAGFSLTAVAAAVMESGIQNNPSNMLDENKRPQTVIRMIQMLEAQKAQMAMQTIVKNSMSDSLDEGRKKEKEQAIAQLSSIVGSSRAIRIATSLEKAAGEGSETVEKAITQATVNARRIIRLHAREFDGLVPRTEGPRVRNA